MTEKKRGNTKQNVSNETFIDETGNITCYEINYFYIDLFIFYITIF